MNPKKISISDFTYQLPDDKIALHPLAQRDASKLLVYKEGLIKEDVYQNIHEHLPENSLLIFNNTKVIKARILFTKSTGAVIEIFLLQDRMAYLIENNLNSMLIKLFDDKISPRSVCILGERN
jgi:S-adenosylmethionine:tRNA ribosyltransferase-isomerase